MDGITQVPSRPPIGGTLPEERPRIEGRPPLSNAPDGGSDSMDNSTRRNQRDERRTSPAFPTPEHPRGDQGLRPRPDKPHRAPPNGDTPETRRRPPGLDV